MIGQLRIGTDVLQKQKVSKRFGNCIFKKQDEIAILRVIRTVTCFLAYILTIYVAFELTYILAFHLANILKSFLVCFLTGYLAF